MPTVTAFFDAFKEAFGSAYVENCMVEGLRGGTCYACENGFEVGIKPAPPPPEAVFDGDQWKAWGDKCRLLGLDPTRDEYHAVEIRGNRR